MATYFRSVLLPAVRDGRVDTVLSYRQHTPLKVSAELLLRETSLGGVGFINASPLHSAFLTGADPRAMETGGHAAVARWQELAIALHELCSGLGVPILDAALQFPLRESRIDITLTGPASASEVDSSVRALGRPIPQRGWAAIDGWQATLHDRHDE